MSSRFAILFIFTLAPAGCGGSPSASNEPDGSSADSGSLTTGTGSSEAGAGSGSSGGGEGADSGGGGESTTDSGNSEASVDGSAPVASGLHVVMGSNGLPGHIVDGSGNMVRLHGADRSGTEFECLSGTFFDGPGDQTGIDAMKTWHINAVRVPLNEDCWLGINGVPTASGGANYQSAIPRWVNLLTQNGMIVVVDLHWTAPGTTLANAQAPMADADHSAHGLVADRQDVRRKRSGNLRSLQRAVRHGLGLLGQRRHLRATERDNAHGRRHGLSATGRAERRGPERGHHGRARLFERHVSVGVVRKQHSRSRGAAERDQHRERRGILARPPFQLGAIGLPESVQRVFHVGHVQHGAVTATDTSATSVLAGGFPIVIRRGRDLGVQRVQRGVVHGRADHRHRGLVRQPPHLDGDGGAGYSVWSWNEDTTPVLITDYTGTPTVDFGTTYQAHLAKF